MNSYLKKISLFLAVLFVLASSAVKTIPAYADDETPPQDVSANETGETPDQTPAGEESSPLSTPEVDPESILSPLPEGTALVVLDEQGVPLSLATEEAAEAMVSSDPIWCPVGVTPTPGLNGCTQSFGQFVTGNPLTGLLDYLMDNQPAMDGVIWVEKTYNGQDNTDIVFNGVNITPSMSGFALTINGGWDTATNTLDLNAPSTFDVSLKILNWANAVTINNILVTGVSGTDGITVSTTGNINLDHVESSTNAGDGADLNSSGGSVTVKNSQFNGNLNQYGLVVNNAFGDITLSSVHANANNNSGIYLITPGNINLTNIQAANNSNSYGAFLNNSSGTGNITITSGQFTANNNGLYMLSSGTITLKDITASNNTNMGAYLDNLSAATSKAVTLNGANTFSNNAGNNGLVINSLGAITLNNVTASKNGGYGVRLDNNDTGGSGAVTLTGFNVFSENSADGLLIFSNGAIKLNNIVTIANAGSGITADNQTALTPQAVILGGTMMAKYNLGSGLYIRSSGMVTAANITANYNATSGLDVDNSIGGTLSSIIISGTNSFSHNQTDGLRLISTGLISLSNIAANGNGSGAVHGNGATLDNSVASSPMDIVISGTNSFDDNFSNGLHAISLGGITINNLNANGNGNLSGGAGVVLGNQNIPSVIKPITITGVNSTSNNRESGLSIQTYGTVTIASLTASNNGLNATSGNGYGLMIANSFGTVASSVTITGTNVFNDNYETNLYILSRGQVTLNAITANNSTTGLGTMIDNEAGKLGVKMTGTNTFNGNQLSNLSIQSRGLITINSVSADNSASGYGIFLQNTNALSAAPITINGVNHASGNWLTGIKVNSLGQINANNLTVLNNGLGSVSAEDYGVVLANPTAVTPAAVFLNGTNNISGNNGSNLHISSKGNITINNLTAKDSTSGHGVYLWNNLAGTLVNITMSGVNVLTGNNSDNLYIQTFGTISLNNITANNSIMGYGAYIANGGGPAPKAVTMSGVNSFNSNHIDGLYIETEGAVTLSNITANGNGSAGVGRGASIVNSYTAILPVTLNGYGIFKNNQEEGLRIQSKGDITVNNVTATGNGLRGVWLMNNTTGKGITLKGQNAFNNNGFTGLDVVSSGAILLNNITANSNLNNGYGAYIDNAHDNFLKPVTLTGQNIFNGNSAGGLVITSFGAVTTNNITASNSVGTGFIGYSGLYIENNSSSASPAITMNGLNFFNSNGGTGLGLFSKGSITASNITAQFNGQVIASPGAAIDNTSSASFAPITLAGKNNFNGNNGSGLSLSSDGTIVTNNITASDNIQSGVNLNNLTAGTVTPKPVTVLGFNQFNNNGAWGLSVVSNGVITTNNLTANFNDTAGYSGVTLNNSAAVKAAAIMVQGVNTFNGNNYAGLSVFSIGSITLNNINVTGNISNSSPAVIIDNHNGASSASVTVTGANISGNNWDGLDIWSNGVVNINKLILDDNNRIGLHVVTNGNVNLTCASVVNNATYGWFIDIPSPAIANLKGVISVGNGTGDEFFPNTGTLVKSISCPLP